MSKHAFAAAFATGLAAVAWVAFGFVGSSWLALLLTAVIAGTYLLGAFELRQFRAGTAGLASALAQVPQPLTSLSPWLEQVPAALRNAVRLRVEGERGGLPGPALTPYLVGLLVMLGMLGTFLGMIVTFQGAVFALEGSTDLQAIRGALAEPIRGLGLSFGSSVAGVAASAMLGLMSAIARRERVDVGRQLDQRIATVLQPVSAAHQRQETFRALQLQARVLPDVMERLEAMVERMEKRSQELDERLAQRQHEFHREMTRAYTDLACDVGSSLKDSLAGSASAAGQAILPVVQSAMAQVGEESRRVQESVARATRQQVQALAESFEERSAALLAGLRDQAGALEASVAQHLASLGTAMEAPLARLVATTSEVPQAAAALLAQLREQASRLAERDQGTLQERTALLDEFERLLRAVNTGAGEQRAATEAMVTSATTVLQDAGTRFAQVLDSHAGRAGDMAAHVSAGALELASVAEAFAQGVRDFHASSDKLAGTLRGIEASLNRSTARSDEQLAYYVAQAREVIDLSIASQQGLVENLRQLQVRPSKSAALATEGRA